MLSRACYKCVRRTRRGDFFKEKQYDSALCILIIHVLTLEQRSEGSNENGSIGMLVSNDVFILLKFFSLTRIL